jgi:hypothetical protein
MIGGKLPKSSCSREKKARKCRYDEEGKDRERYEERDREAGLKKREKNEKSEHDACHSKDYQASW